MSLLRPVQVAASIFSFVRHMYQSCPHESASWSCHFSFSPSPLFHPSLSTTKTHPSSSAVDNNVVDNEGDCIGTEFLTAPNVTSRRRLKLAKVLWSGCLRAEHGVSPIGLSQDFLLSHVRYACWICLTSFTFLLITDQDGQEGRYCESRACLNSAQPSSSCGVRL